MHCRYSDVKFSSRTASVEHIALSLLVIPEMMAGKVDVHTHALPEFFVGHLAQLGQGATGVPKVEWSLDTTRETNAKLGVTTLILSLSAPGPEVVSGTMGARSLARKYNEWASGLVSASFGYFAAVPSLEDTDGCIEEIRYAFDHLKADGVCLFTTYGGKYLGDSSFDPIWKELNERHAVVFIHPNMPPGFMLASPILQPPAFDFPHETGRTAAHLIMTGMKSRYSEVEIILSHGGGTSPILSERLACLETTLYAKSLPDSAPKTADEILPGAKSYYFDLALCGTANVLDTLSRWAPADHVLYGSDYPYCTVEAEYNAQQLEAYPLEDGLRKQYYTTNGLELFPR